MLLMPIRVGIWHLRFFCQYAAHKPSILLEGKGLIYTRLIHWRKGCICLPNLVLIILAVLS